MGAKCFFKACYDAKACFPGHFWMHLWKYARNHNLIVALKSYIGSEQYVRGCTCEKCFIHCKVRLRLWLGSPAHKKFKRTILWQYYKSINMELEDSGLFHRIWSNLSLHSWSTYVHHYWASTVFNDEKSARSCRLNRFQDIYNTVSTTVGLTCSKDKEVLKRLLPNPVYVIRKDT